MVAPPPSETRALVTGAARGIGRAVAETMDAAGLNLVLVDADAEGLHETLAGLAGSQRHRAIFCDLRDEAAIDALAGEVEVAGGLDILVNNAGVWRYATLFEATGDDWDLIFDVNAKAVWLAMKALAPLMIARGGGSIVNVASTAALKARPGLFQYAAAKAAVISMTQSAAVELAAQGVRVNAVAPGPTATEAARARYANLDERATGIPLGRVGTPHEIARAVLFLALPDASFVTGQTLAVNGGVGLA